jgi:hypothetical protein
MARLSGGCLSMCKGEPLGVRGVNWSDNRCAGAIGVDSATMDQVHGMPTIDRDLGSAFCCGTGWAQVGACQFAGSWELLLGIFYWVCTSTRVCSKTAM